MTNLLTMAKRHRIRRSYLRLAALYRRGAGRDTGDFSFEALVAAHAFESRGGEPPPSSNGYMAGKHFMDITVTEAKAAIRAGEMCKAEFYNSPTKWFWLKKLEHTPAGELFAWRH